MIKHLCILYIGIIDCITDCFDALKYICLNNEQLGIDKHKISLSGHSAGGYLVLMLAYAPYDLFIGNDIILDYTIKSVSPMNPLTILFDGEYPASHHLEDMSGRFKSKNCEQNRKTASPVCHVSENVPPTFLFAGTSDYLVYSISSEILYD